MARHIIEQGSFLSLTPYASRDSILSISSWDYSSSVTSWEQLVEGAASTSQIVLNSTVLDIIDISRLIEMRGAYHSGLRVQVSMGTELEKHLSSLQRWLAAGGGVDVLVDRPVSSQGLEVLKGWRQKEHLRICVLANKYFSLPATLNSLRGTFQDKIHLIFLPPTSTKSCYFSADEVVHILAHCEEVHSLPILVFKGAIEKQSGVANRDFFLSFDASLYLMGNSQWSQGLQSLRRLMAWMTKRRLIFLMDFLYAALMLMKEPSWKNFSRPGKFIWHKLRQLLTWSYVGLRHKAWGRLKFTANWIYVFIRHRLWGLTKWSLSWVYVLLRHRLWTWIHIFFRYKLMGLLRAMRSNLFVLIRYRLWGLLRQAASWVFVLIRYRLWGLLRQTHSWIFVMVRYRLWGRLRRVGSWAFVLVRYHLWGWLIRFWSLVRYQAFPKFMDLVRVLFYPLFKVYWFCSYQYQNRVLPLFGKETEKE